MKLRADGEAGPPGVAVFQWISGSTSTTWRSVNAADAPAGRRMVFTRRQLARQLDVTKADPAETEHVAAERGEDPADLARGAADDRERRQHARFSGNVQVGCAGSRDSGSSPLIFGSCVVENQLVRQWREWPRQRRLVGPWHRGFGCVSR